MDGAAPLDAGAGTGAATGTAAQPGNDVAAALLAMQEHMAAQFAIQNAAMQALTERVLAGESRDASRAGSDADEEFSDAGSVAESEVSDGPPQYLKVDASTNRHWNAPQRALDADQRPRRHSLYGYEPFDVLASGKHKGGGTLGTVMRYVEPSCLYLQTALDGVRAAADAIDAGVDADDLREHLHACANTLSGVYGLTNTLRTLVVERANVTAKGATAADKKRMQWVEQQLDEDDFARADVAPRIRRLKAQYDYEAGKAELRKLAGSGGATSSGGGYASESKKKKKPKSARRSSRSDDEESGGGGGGGRIRDKGSKAKGAKPKADAKPTKPGAKHDAKPTSKAGGGGKKAAKRSDARGGGGGGLLPERTSGGGGGAERHGGGNGRGARRNSGSEGGGSSGSGSDSSSDSDN